MTTRTARLSPNDAERAKARAKKRQKPPGGGAAAGTSSSGNGQAPAKKQNPPPAPPGVIAATPVAAKKGTMIGARMRKKFTGYGTFDGTAVVEQAGRVVIEWSDGSRSFLFLADAEAAMLRG